jgi:hypothetical protein
MSDRYNPFGLPYLDRPVDTPNYSVDSRWPDQPSVADAFQMGHLASTDQYSPTTYAPFDAYDRAQQAQHRDEKQQQAMQRSADVARALSGQGQGPADIRTPVAGMRMGDLAGEMLAPDDVLGASTLFNPVRVGRKAIPAAAGAILGSDTAEAGGARDPRLWSSISPIKLSKPLDQYAHRYTDVRAPPTPRFINPEDLVGSHGLFTPWDLSAIGKTLTHVDDKALQNPVPLHGGVGFQQANPGMAAASEQAISRRLENEAERITRETGKPPVIIPITMAPTGVDASHHVADPLAQLVQTAPIKADDLTAFNDMMRARVAAMEAKKKNPADRKVWMDTTDPGFADYISSMKGGMTLKAAMADRMGLAEWQKKGFPDVAAVRHAVSEPALIEAPRNSVGMTFARYIPGQGLLKTDHPSYPHGVAGQHMGQLASLIPFEKAAPTIVEGLARVNAANRAMGKKVAIQPAYHLGRPTEGVPVSQYFDQEWADNIRRHWGDLK